MAITKFELCSSALVTIGANPIASFNATGTAEEVAAFHLYQNCVNHWLSLHPWRFATRVVQLSRHGATAPPTQWTAAYRAPPGMLAMQALRVDVNGNDIPFDRFEDQVWCNAGEAQKVWCVHTYDVPIAYWPGYFVALMEQALAVKFAFALSGKLDLRVDLEKGVDFFFRIAKNADSRQQTSRRFKVAGRGSIMEARRA